MAECKNMKGIEEYRFYQDSTCDYIRLEQYRKRDANGEFVYAGDLIVFTEGDFIPEEVFIDGDRRMLAVDSYHAFHLLDKLTSFTKYKVE